jgi:hypothetical protein
MEMGIGEEPSPMIVALLWPILGHSFPLASEPARSAALLDLHAVLTIIERPEAVHVTLSAGGLMTTHTAWSYSCLQGGLGDLKCPLPQILSGSLRSTAGAFKIREHGNEVCFRRPASRGVANILQDGREHTRDPGGRNRPTPVVQPSEVAARKRT